METQVNHELLFENTQQHNRVFLSHGCCEGDAGSSNGHESTKR